jgi:NADH:ubiquinone oxidoreductase subunit 6 (subunit J)
MDFTLEQFLFWVFGLTACGAAILVAATQNVVRIAFWLVISLGSVAALFFLLHADLLGATQLLIYVGGTVVVLIFGVMLTASGPYLKIQTSPGDLLMGAGVGTLLLALLINSVCSTDWAALTLDTSGTVLPVAAADNPEGGTARPLGLGFLGMRPDQDLASNPTAKLSPGYLLPFEIISVHLLVVLIGAAYLARAKRRATTAEPPV